MPIAYSHLLTQKPRFIQVNEPVTGSPNPLIEDSNHDLNGDISTTVQGVDNRHAADLWALMKLMVTLALEGHNDDGTHDFTDLIAELTGSQALTNQNISDTAGIEEHKLALCFWGMTRLFNNGVYSSDGIGTCQLAEDLFALYNRVLNGETYKTAEARRVPRLLKVETWSGFLPPHRSPEGNGVGYVAETDGGVFPSSAFDGERRHAYDGTIYTQKHSLITAADANRIVINGGTLQDILINGQLVNLEGRITRGHNLIIEFAAPPNGGARHDLIAVEVWREEVDPRTGEDLFFPFGNVHYDPYDQETTINNCVLYSDDQTIANYPDYLAPLAGGYGPHSTGGHGKYVKANDPNIDEFMTDPMHNVGVTPDGQFTQIRYRIVVLEGVDPEIMSNHYINDGSLTFFRPQGQKATRPGPGNNLSTDGIFVEQDGFDIHRETILDPGMYLGGKFTATTSLLQTITGLSDDGFVYLLPLAVVHRRNTAAWSIENLNGAPLIGASNDRPDGLFADEINLRDVLPLQHRIFPAGYDFQEMLHETYCALKSSVLRSTWEQMKVNPGGCSPNLATDIYGTILTRVDGVRGVGAAFNTNWGVLSKDLASNGTSARFDGVRNYYSDYPGEQYIQGWVIQENVDGALPTTMWSYDADTHTLSFDTTDMESNDQDLNPLDPSPYNTQLSGRVPDLCWGGPFHAGTIGSNTVIGVPSGHDGQPPHAWVDWSAYVGPTIMGTIHKGTPILTTGVAPVFVGPTDFRGAVYSAPNGVQSTLLGVDEVFALLCWSFEGTTFPNTGTWTKISGSGPATFAMGAGYVYEAYLGFFFDINNGPNYSFNYTNPGSYVQYVGEGYDFHPTESLFAGIHVVFTVGGGWLSAPTVDFDYEVGDTDGIHRTYFFVGGYDVMPEDGQGYYPFGTVVDEESFQGGYPDPHTKSLGFVGFIRRDAVLDVGALGANDAVKAYRPCILKDGSTYKMWYTGFDGVNSRIIYAESADGITWVNHQIAIDLAAEATADTDHAKEAWVVKDGATYRMWYTGGDAFGVERIIYCQGTDGVNFASFQVAINPGVLPTYDADLVSAPSVVKEGLVFTMIYSGLASGLRTLIYATSSNGTTWANHFAAMVPPIRGTFDSRGEHHPCLIKDGQYYRMWYTGLYSTDKNAIMFAVSKDAKHWCGHQLVVGSKTQGSLDDYGVNSPCVIKDDKTYRMWFGGIKNDLDQTTRILHAVLSMADLLNSGSALKGIYTTGGSQNHAPGVNDSIVMFYSSPAVQTDFRRFTENIVFGFDLDYQLRYIDKFGLLTSLGTSGFPLAFHSDYRDFVFHTVPWYSWNLEGGELDTETAEPVLSQATSMAWRTWRDYHHYYVDGPHPPCASEFLFFEGLTGLDGPGLYFRAKKAGFHAFGEGNMHVFTPQLEGSCFFLAGIGQKDWELFMPVAAGVLPLEQDQLPIEDMMHFNLIGRPLVKS